MLSAQHRSSPSLSAVCLTCIFCKTAIVFLIEIPYISIVLSASYIRNHDTHPTFNSVGGKSLSLNDKSVHFLL